MRQGQLGLHDFSGSVAIRARRLTIEVQVNVTSKQYQATRFNLKSQNPEMSPGEKESRDISSRPEREPENPKLEFEVGTML